MKNQIKFLLVLLLMVTSFPGLVSATTYYESYVGQQGVGEGCSYNFGFDFWYDNDVYMVGTNSSLKLAADASGMAAEEQWLSSILYIEFSSEDDALESATITLTAWDEYGTEEILNYEFDLGYTSGWGCKKVYHEETDTYSYVMTGDIMSAFEQVGWGNVNIKADCSFDFSYNDFYINKVAMEVVTGTSTPNPEPVPEPATMFLLGSGLIGLAGIRRKKK